MDDPALPRYKGFVGGRILIVDDDADDASMLRGALRRRSYEVESMSSGQDALDWLDTHEVDIVLAHVRMDRMTGVELCAALHERHAEVAAIMMTGDEGLDRAIAAIRAGAYDYIRKPIDLEALVLALERALAHVSLGRELHRLRAAVEATRPIPSIVGDSPSIQKVIEVVHRVADSDTTVLIVGESGTGKELVARAIHDGSPRREEPFAAINCAAMPPGLLESELFGHVKGAFTDARRARPGLFVTAGAGTVFLDEIGEMPPEMQVKLLRVLQERRVRPVGADTDIPFEARVICATNRDLESDVAEKRFREDLYYRINVVQIPVPPLRARAGDILILADHIIKRIAARTGKAVLGLGAEAARALLAYDWPGNVRELENSLERAIALTRVDELAAEDLPDKVREHRRAIFVTATGSPDELITLEEVEHHYIRQVMTAVGGNKAMAARILGIDRRSLYRRLETPEGDGDPPAPTR